MELNSEREAKHSIIEVTPADPIRDMLDWRVFDLLIETRRRGRKF